ncbi:hypothetical protein GGF46_001557, partial [Coemansia sp. RSA 552]
TRSSRPPRTRSLRPIPKHRRPSLAIASRHPWCRRTRTPARRPSLLPTRIPPPRQGPRTASLPMTRRPIAWTKAARRPIAWTKAARRPIAWTKTARTKSASPRRTTSLTARTKTARTRTRRATTWTLKTMRTRTAARRRRLRRQCWSSRRCSLLPCLARCA